MTVPPLRQPPHDPLTLRLGGRLGWPGVSTERLVLPLHPDAVRHLTEPSGSFGGLRLPANVCLWGQGADAELLLLDRTGLRLRRFDACECRFVDLDGFGGAGPAVGQLDRPGGIAAAADRLVVCDTGNSRLQVVVLPQLVVSATWRPPRDQVPAWQPVGAAVDEHLRVHVADPQNGCVHRFSWSGRYLGCTTGLGAVRHVAVAVDGTVYAAGELAAYRLDPVLGAVPVPTTAEESSALLGAAGLAVAADGCFAAGRLAPACPPEASWFDLRGTPCTARPGSRQTHELTSTVVLGPLDSGLDSCLWHRLVVSGDLPPGSGFTVTTYTAQVALSAQEVADLPDPAWETRLTCTGLAAGQWDGLLRSPAGRYLWIRLALFGNGRSTPRLDEAVVEFPRISLRRYLPAVYGADPVSADFTDRLLGVFDRSLRDLEQRIDELPALFDPRATPALDWLASWVGMRVDHRLPEALNRELLAGAGHLMDLRGTATGLWRMLVVALGFDRVGCLPAATRPPTCRPARQSCPPAPPELATSWQPPPLILEHFRLRRWFETGAATVGDQAVLWGQSIVNRSQLGGSAQVGVTALKGTQDPARDPFHVHAHQFTVFAPARAGSTPSRRLALERLVDWATPAQAKGHVRYVSARMRIGVQSTIGLDTAIARMPAGVTLGQTPLGPASVLDGVGGSTIDTSAVGTTAVLG